MVYIILPAYNEEEGIEKLLERFKRITATFIPSYKVIIVNDGSRDHTLPVIECFKRELNIDVISFPQNKGIVDVFLAGFKKVCAEGADEDICITMDSDNTQSPFILMDIINQINAGNDIVIASRFAKGGKMIGVPWVRYVLSFGVSIIMGNIAKIPGVTDYSTFYRGMRVRVLKEGLKKYGDRLIEGKGFSGMGSLLVKLHPFANNIVEVPLVLRYDLKGGQSGMRIFKSIMGYLTLFYKILRKTY